MPYALETSYREGLLHAVFGGGALPVIPAAWSLGLYNGNPLTGALEMSGVNYARQSVASSFWTSGAGTPNPPPGVVGNALELRWPATGTAGTGGWAITQPFGANRIWLGLHDAGGTVRAAVSLLDRDVIGALLAAGSYLVSSPGEINFYQVNAPATMEVALSLAFRSQLTRWLLAGDALTIPSTWDWSLWVGSPFANGYEVYDPEYARISRPNDGTEWTAATGGSSAVNALELRWPAAGSPLRPWGLVTHLCLGAGGAAPSIALRLSSPAAVGPNVPLELDPGKIVVNTIF